MRMLFKQRFFSWLDRYDIFSEEGYTLFTVKGKLSWGHCLEIYDAQGVHIGTLKEEVLTFLPRFRIYLHGNYQGEIKKEFTFFKPAFHLDYNGWRIEGDFFEWEYQIKDVTNHTLAQVSKQILNFTDTYSIEVEDPGNALICLMIVLAIDAAKCSSKNG